MGIRRNLGARMSAANETSNTGLVLGGLVGAAIGYMRWGNEGLLLGLLGALLGALAETAFFAGRAGRASLLISLVPLSLFGFIAYLVYRFFR